jgi:hypothetical protein
MIRSITNGSVSGTDTIDCPKQVLGGVFIYSDGTNAAVVQIANDTADGTNLISFTTLISGYIPLGIKCSNKLHINISGTNAVAQVFEYIA